MSNRITVVKIGGNVVDSPDALARFITGFSKLPGRKILVHGGGKEATRLSSKLGIATQMIAGRRVTDRSTLDVVTMVYAGLINKRITALLQASGVNAVGLCGADGNVITAKRRNPNPIDYGFVGDIDAADVNAAFIRRLLDAGMVPVLCAVMYDGAGGLLNCNADSVASAVAVGVSRIAPSHLIFCFEKNGVLRNVDDPDSVIERITPDIYAILRGDDIISDGMIPKIENALASIRSGVKSVTIKHSDNLLKQQGTVIEA